MVEKQFHTTAEVADRAGISRDTLLRWLKSGKIPEPDRDRNGHRIFTDEDVEKVLKHATKVIPSPQKRQGSLSFAKSKSKK